MKTNHRLKRLREWVARAAFNLKLRALRALSDQIPLHFVRRAYLRAFYKAWEVSHPPPAPDPDDVYVNGLSWTPRPLPPEEADRLLALHDAAVEKDMDFSRILEENLHK